MEGGVTNVAFPPVTSQVYQHQAPHPPAVRHHTAAVSAQPVLLQPLPSTEFIVSSYNAVFVFYLTPGRRFGLVVTRLSQLTKLLYAGPG